MTSFEVAKSNTKLLSCTTKMTNYTEMFIGRRISIASGVTAKGLVNNKIY